MFQYDKYGPSYIRSSIYVSARIRRLKRSVCGEIRNVAGIHESLKKSLLLTSKYHGKSSLKFLSCLIVRNQCSEPSNRLFKTYFSFLKFRDVSAHSTLVSASSKGTIVFRWLFGGVGRNAIYNSLLTSLITKQILQIFCAFYFVRKLFLVPFSVLRHCFVTSFSSSQFP